MGPFPRDKLLAELAEIEKSLPDIESGAVYVGVPGDDGDAHRAYLRRLRTRRAEIQDLLKEA